MSYCDLQPLGDLLECLWCGRPMKIIGDALKQSRHCAVADAASVRNPAVSGTALAAGSSPIDWTDEQLPCSHRGHAQPIPRQGNLCGCGQDVPFTVFACSLLQVDVSIPRRHTHVPSCSNCQKSPERAAWPAAFQ